MLTAIGVFLGTNGEARGRVWGSILAHVSQMQRQAAPAQPAAATVQAPSKPSADEEPAPPPASPVLGATSWQPSAGNRVWAPIVEAPSVARGAQPARSTPAPGSVTPKVVRTPVAAAPQPAAPPARVAPAVTPQPVAAPAKPARAPAAPRSAAQSDEDAAAAEVARQARAHLEGTL